MPRRGIVPLLTLCACTLATADVADLLRSSGVKGGLVVHLGCGDGTETVKLRLGGKFLVQGLAVDDESVQRARRNIQGAGAYGSVSVYRFDGKRLPYVDNLVNVFVSEGPTSVPQQEILRALAPLGTALIDGDRIDKPWPAEIDEWHHFLHGPSNNAVSTDTVVDSPRSLQWVSVPRWGRSHEELASMSGAVSARGRVFFIVDEAPLVSIRFPGQWKLVARDAFNGVLLWKRDIPAWSDHLRHFRAGPVHLPRRLVAVGERVYVTLGLTAPVTALDAATGETVRTYAGTERAEEILVQDGLLYIVTGTSEAHRTGDGLYARGEPEPTDFRAIQVLEAETGKLLWKRRLPRGEFLLPLSLAVRGQNVYYQSTFGVACLNAQTGAARWRTKQPTVGKRMSFSAPTLVATDDVVLCADRVPQEKGDEHKPAEGGVVLFGVHGWNQQGFARKGKCLLRAYAADTGSLLWSADASEGYNSPVDVFVVGDTVWVGSNYKGYDLRTGQLRKELKWKGAPVAMPHHRCYRNKATEKLILTGRAGIEVVSLEDGWIGNNSWIRGTCQYGIMPSNGLLYAPPDACACFNKVKVPGFFAAAPRRGKDGHLPFDEGPRLEQGPAYDQASSASVRPIRPEEWPAYRSTGSRSGAVQTSVPAALKRHWSAKIGGKLTQPIIAGGSVYVASTDTHTVHALSAFDGAHQWQYTAGARIDSAPTFHDGRLFFGSADGWIYCLNAADGALAWRFQAAPQERMANVFGQLESLWPVHGAVLIQDGVLYATAGRSTYLDGGLVLYRLDPRTGEELSRTILTDLDPDTDEQTGHESNSGFDMEGTMSDILSGDGESVFLKHLRFDKSGKEAPQDKPHLFSITGLVGEDWFVRSYWLIGTQVNAGWGGWARAAGTAPFGRILCFDDSRVYGYGRKQIQSGPTGHKADTYHLYALDRAAGAAAGSAAKRRGKGQPAKQFLWSVPDAPIVRAMALAGDHLLLAGPPDLGEKESDLLAFKNASTALAGFQGRRGCFLQVRSTAEGSKLSEQRLTELPVFDGMSAADGAVFLSLKNGMVECWRG